MYQRNPLLEFAPSDLIMSAKAAKPAFQQFGLSAKRALNGGKTALKSKNPLKSVAKMVRHNAATDKTMIGSALRGGNTGLDVAKFSAVAYTPPMPSPDTRSINNVIQSVKGAAGKESSQRVAAARLGRTIQHPVKTARRFLDRTVTGAVTDMPMLSMPGYTGPNPMYGIANGMKAKDVYRLGKDAIGYNVDRAKGFFRKLIPS